MGGTHLALCSLQLGADLLQACVQRSKLSFAHAHTVLAAGSRLANTQHSTLDTCTSTAQQSPVCRASSTPGRTLRGRGPHLER